MSSLLMLYSRKRDIVYEAIEVDANISNSGGSSTSVISRMANKCATRMERTTLGHRGLVAAFDAHCVYWYVLDNCM